MRKIRSVGLFGLGMAFLGLSSGAFAVDAVRQAISGGNVNGNVRAHYNSRHYSAVPNASAFALGGALRAETAPLGWTKVGVGFYTAQDLGTNPDNPLKVDGRMGSELEVLGEAYINFAGRNSSLTVGRQKIVTPFANPIDVFIVPFTFEGVSFKNTSIPYLTLEFDYINTIKSAGSAEFVDVGTWSTRRLGVETAETSGTMILGGKYNKDALAIQAWLYNFSDLFNSRYLQIDYSFADVGLLKPFVAAQVITQSSVGDELLGNVDSTLYGLQAGTSLNRAQLILGYTHVAEKADSFNNGAFLAPYNFSTSPLFTNNMLQTMENMDAGEAMKLTLLYEFPRLTVKLSYTHLKFSSLADRGATDFDLIYTMDRYVAGLSLRYRLEIVTSPVTAVEQSDHRFQIQYVF